MGWRILPLLLVLWPAALAGAALGAEVRAFCYRTLAEVVCYTRPDAGRERRFVGFFDLPEGWRRVPAEPHRDPPPPRPLPGRSKRNDTKIR